MTSPARRPVVYGLHVDLGEHTRPWAPRYGMWLRVPSADCRCPCGWTASASGDAVTAFVSAVRDRHLKTCPLRKDDAA